MKPENILILRDNENYSIKLADFGISKDLSATTLSTLNAPGTLAWIAPEVIRNGHVRIIQIFKFYFIVNQ